MNFKSVTIEAEGGIAVVYVDRPKKLNALNRETIAELGSAFAALEDDREVRVIILTGSGSKAFVAGADIAEFSGYSEAEGRALAAEGQHQLFDRIENLTTPVIAAINGFALGGGLELAMACHFRVASTNAKMGLPEVSLGVIPGYGGTQRLPRLVGKGRAMEMILTGGMIRAEKALEYGLINHITAPEDLLEYCHKLGEQILKNSSVAISYAIKAINAGFSSSQTGFQAEINAFGDCFGTDDFEEGTRAFLEKRSPDFPGA